jgi:hypothetical protein
MKHPKATFGDLLAAVAKNTASSSLRKPATDETGDLQKQLDDARREAQNALAEWRSYPTPYYEAEWTSAIAKVRSLEAKIPKRKATSGG